MREDLRVRVGADVTGLKQALGQAQKEVQDFGRRMKRVGMSLAGVLGPATWMGANFEKNMRFVGAVVNATGKELEEMTKLARHLGATTEYTASQAAEGLKFLGMAGFNARESMEALPGVLDLATAGMMSLGEAADIATNILTQMGLEVSELGRVNDVLAKVQSTANTTIQQAAEAFVYGGTMAKKLGMSVEELSAFIGLLANRGIRASLAGTTLRQAMLKLLDPTKEAQEILDRYNISLRDGEGRMKNFTEVILQMVDSQMSAEEVSKLLGARAQQLSSLFDMTSQEIRNYITLLEQSRGTSEKLAQSIRDTLWGSFKSLWSAIQEVGLALYESYRDPLKELTDATVEYTRELGNWIRLNEELVRQKVTDVLTTAKDTLFSIVDFIKRYPEIAEFGVIGWAMFGAKGRLIGLGIGTALNQLKKVLPQTEEEVLKRQIKTFEEQRRALANKLKSMEGSFGLFKQSPEQKKAIQDQIRMLTARINTARKSLATLKEEEEYQKRLNEAFKEGMELNEGMNEAWAAGERYFLKQEKAKAEEIKKTARAAKEAARQRVQEEKKAAQEILKIRKRLEKQAKEQLEAMEIPQYEPEPDQMRALEADKKMAELREKRLKEEYERIFRIRDHGIQREIEQYEKLKRETEKITKEITNSMVGGFSEAFMGIIRGTMSVKDAFSNMARSILNDIAQILMRQLIVKPLTGMLEPMVGGLVKGITGWFTGGGSVGDVGTTITTSTVEGTWVHSGGVIGQTALPTRKVPAEWFRDAPRLHNGLSPDEFPAILKKGETVLPAGERKPPDIQINIINQTGQGVEAEQAGSPSWDGQKWVMEMVLKGLDTSYSFRRAIRSA